MKITVAGIGYVGLSNAILLAQDHEVTVVDISEERVELLNQRKSPIADREVEEYLAEKSLQLAATTKAAKAYTDADYIIIATPTDYHPEKNFFDTSSIEAVLDTIKAVNPDAVVIIKSTVPVGYTRKLRRRYGMKHIIFSPEF